MKKFILALVMLQSLVTSPVFASGLTEYGDDHIDLMNFVLDPAVSKCFRSISGTQGKLIITSYITVYNVEGLVHLLEGTTDAGDFEEFSVHAGSWKIKVSDTGKGRKCTVTENLE